MLLLNNYKIKYEDKIIEYNDIEIKNGEFIGISGTSGCGKTSLLNSLFGYKFVGEIEYSKAELLGKDIKLFGRDKYKYISYCPQCSQNALNPKLSVIEHIRFTLSSNGIRYDYKKIIRLLNELGLEESILSYYPYMLSGGQKQRIIVLLCVIKEPKLLVLDEPSSAVDIITLKIIVDFLVKIKDSYTIIIVSHDIKFLNKLCDRIINI